MTKTVLINVPRLNVPGGVTNYFQVLRNHLGSGRQYFEIGSRANESGSVRRIKRTLIDYWRFHRKLSTEEYSLVHLNPSLGSKSILRDALFLLIARVHSVPVLVFFHGWDDHFQDFIRRRLSLFFRYVFNKAAGLIVLAKDFREQLETMGIGVPIYQMTTCVDNSIFEKQGLEGDSKGRVNILYLSRLDHGKGVVEAINSFSSVRRETPHATLTIAGDGPERKPAEQVVRKQHIEDVHFLGHVEGDKKRRAFLESDIFFFPTFYGEGMPIVVLEAMSYGLPVITRAVGGLKDFFEHERMGYITESSDTGDLATMLQSLVQDPELRSRMGQYNCRYAQEHFAASVVAKDLEGIYARVAR